MSLPVAARKSDWRAFNLGVFLAFSAISLLDTLDLQRGDWLAQNAANGAVGRLVAQLAQDRGIEVLGLVRHLQRRAEVREVVLTKDPDRSRVLDPRLLPGRGRRHIPDHDLRIGRHRGPRRPHVLRRTDRCSSAAAHRLGKRG